MTEEFQQRLATLELMSKMGLKVSDLRNQHLVANINKMYNWLLNGPQPEETKVDKTAPAPTRVEKPVYHVIELNVSLISGIWSDVDLIIDGKPTRLSDIQDVNGAYPDISIPHTKFRLIREISNTDVWVIPTLYRAVVGVSRLIVRPATASEVLAAI